MAKTTDVPAVKAQERLPREFPIILSAQFLTSVGFAFSTPFLPLFIAELGSFTAREAAFWSGIVATCSGVVMVFAGPFWGIVADWFGYKRNALRAAFAACLIVAATGICQNILQMGIVRALMGGFTGVIPANMGLLSAVLPRSRLAYGVGIAQGMGSLGFTLGPLIGGLAVVWLGYRWGFGVSGLLIGIAGAIILFGVRSVPQAKNGNPKNFRQLLIDLRSMLAFPGMKGALLLVAATQLAPNMVFPALVFFVKSLGENVSPGTIGVYFTVTGLAATAAAWGIGALSTRYPLKALLVVACGIGAAGAAGMAVSQSVLMATILGCVAGVGGGMLIAGSSAYVGAIAPQGRSGAAFGWVQSANAVGFGFGPFVGGSLASVFGLRTPFAAEAVLFLLLALVVVKLRKT